MERQSWKIVYSDYTGPEKKAVELVSRELGKYLVRDPGEYRIRVLPCEKEGAAALDRNAVVLGTYGESAILRSHFREDEIPEGGYAVKVADAPGTPDRKLVLIAAKEKTGVFYGAVDFVDEYLPSAIPDGVVVQWYDLFTKKLPDYSHASAPVIGTRCVFTWGHPINDYRAYIDNMARLRFNQLIIWNDYVPVNAADVAAYAHEYGIRVIWGFAWGWTPGCGNTARTVIRQLDAVSGRVAAQYEREYAGIPGDGIYFQTITEHSSGEIDGTCVAEAVTDFVNRTAARILEAHPDLPIQFGLHATSVRDHLDHLRRVDERIEILWEDCGSYPYDSRGYEEENGSEGFEDALRFTGEILRLRPAGRTGVLFKKMTIMDWTRFVHQSGPYVLGCASEEVARHDLEMVLPSWRKASAYCLAHGRQAYETARVLAGSGKRDLTAGLAAQLSGGIWLPEALYAQLFWECDRPYEEILKKVTNRPCLTRV